MKKINSIILTILLPLSLTAIGCKSIVQNKAAETNKNTTENDNFETRRNSPRDHAIFEQNEERDNTELDKRYKEVDKSKLDYEGAYSSSTYCETKNSFVGSEAGIPSVDNKKYTKILDDYTYAREVNPTNVTYEDAIKLAKSVLPDDIKEIRKKYDSSTTKTYIAYSSNQGNFVVGLAYPHADTDNFIPTSDKDIVVGIDYMKEIIN